MGIIIKRVERIPYLAQHFNGDVKMDFGQFIKKKRMEKKISARQLAEEINISTVYQSSFENGKRAAPSDEILKRTAKALELTPEETNIMYNLAAQTRQKMEIPHDVAKYVTSRPNIWACVRLAKDKKLKNADWAKVHEFIENNF